MTGICYRLLPALAIVAIAGAANTAGAACKLGRIAELPVTMTDRRPTITAQINGMDARFLVDSGAFYSMLSAASAAEFNLKPYPVPFGLYVKGVGGDINVSVATVKVFTLAGVPLRDREFLVGGSEVGQGSVGVLGQNVLRIADVEYDLAKGIIALMQEEDCRKMNAPYWISGTSQSYSVMNMQPTTPLQPQALGSATVNGVTIRVMFDTGADTSFLSLRAAERAGIKIDAPGVVFAGNSGGIGRKTTKTWIAPVASFKLGNEEVRNTRLRIGESLNDTADMLLGADFFLSHRVYVANKLDRIFFTYNGGPVFNLSVTAAARAASEQSAHEAPAPESPAAASSAVESATAASSDGPKNAAEFSRRGTAFAGRRDFVHAIADLTRACELAPGEPDYFYERGIAHWEGQEPIPALADFDRTLQLKPDHVPALLARAELRLEGDRAQAIEDLDAADRVASKEADARLRMALAYAHAGLPAQAKTQLDLWIAAHAVDSRLGNALAERCRIRALSGQELKPALDDCNAALKRSDQKDAASARIFDSRGLVRLRLGDYDKSIADYTASLNLRPRDAWALYGRGVAETRRGRAAEGQTDIAAASAVWAPIAEAFAKVGILP